MKIEPRTIKDQHIGNSNPKPIKGRGYFDGLVLWQIGDIFEVGWEDSAHHYWHSEYYTTIDEADAVYEDYSANGIPDEYEDGEEFTCADAVKAIIDFENGIVSNKVKVEKIL